MTSDFTAFFDLVRKAARQHDIRAYLICGVTSEGAGKHLRIASHGTHSFDETDAKFIAHCVDAMGESLDITLSRLAGDDTEVPQPVLPN